MSKLTSWFLVTALAMTPMAFANAQGVGAWRPVKDDIGFFSPRAEEQANQKVAEIKKKFNKDLAIEVIKSVPLPKSVDAKDNKAVNAFYKEFAEKRFDEMHDNGVAVLIIEKEHQLRVVVGNNTRAKGYFSIANRDQLGNMMLAKLKDKDKDGALLSGVNYVYETMSTNRPVTQKSSAVAPVGHVDAGGHARPASSGFNWTTLLTILAVIAGVWIVFALVRGLFAGGGGGGAPGMGYGGGGGGFMSNFLGGLVGAAAGMWMYNTFFGHSGSSAWGASPPTDAGSSPSADAPDTSGSAGGGDYGADDAGDAGGGGDWGGDAGGGDAGGGDLGGGGGDFGGGGGGDW